MDEDRIEGTLKEGAGKVKEEWGDATDDASTELGGQKDQLEGEVQQRWGEAKDAVRDEDRSDR
ncbi:MAG: CsbD family protein [Chloroflexota bacterium]|nr:CsbD family protein [Chloroflexota bacterium]